MIVHGKDNLAGVVERITFVNEENGYTVAKLKCKGEFDLITVVGNFSSVKAGAVLSARGTWRMDAKYGRQFQVEDYEERLPATAAGIEKYLGSGLIKGIGPVNAKRIVKVFKGDTLQVIEEQTERLLEVEGIGKKRVEMIKKAWEEQKEVKNIMIFLQTHGVSTAYGVKIYKCYGNESIDVVQKNPFRLADDIWGIGFKTADSIAQNLGFDLQSYVRLRSGMLYVLNDMAGDGHCYLTREQILDKTYELLEIDKDLLVDALHKMLDEGVVIGAEEEAIFLPAFYHSELGVARRLKEITQAPSPLRSVSIDAIVKTIAEKQQIQYDGKQLEAIRTAAASKLMVLTGGPGTGKTFTTLGIISYFKALSAGILLAAPTGRAAKRMSEVTGLEARTIHRLLEFKPTDGYTRKEDNPLICDVLILDEVSMIDLILMYNLLKAVPNETIVILVGDVDQLPSVGAGNVLRDIIDSSIVEVVKLTSIFRQAQDSQIITNAHRVNQGLFPSLSGQRDRDFFFIEEEEPDKAADIIIDLVTRRLPTHYKLDPVRDIQVLCPMLRGTTGAHKLNQRLQEKLIKEGLSVLYGGTHFRAGDKIMQIKNNYDKGIFNGDIGYIESLHAEDRTIRVSYDDIVVEYDYTELDEVVLAYACTVHKSQGSEYPMVVAPLTTQHYMMLQRNLLYTCITRAKKVFILVGSKKAIAIAIRNDKTAKRNTMLALRIQNAFS